MLDISRQDCSTW